MEKDWYEKFSGWLRQLVTHPWRWLQAADSRGSFLVLWASPETRLFPTCSGWWPSTAWLETSSDGTSPSGARPRLLTRENLGDNLFLSLMPHDAGTDDDAATRSSWYLSDRSSGAPACSWLKRTAWTWAWRRTAVQRHTPPPAAVAEHLCAWSGASAAAAARQSAPPGTPAHPPPRPAQLKNTTQLKKNSSM